MSDENAIKKSGALTEFTEEMKFEVLKCTEDPVYFIRNYVKIQHPMDGTVDFIPFDYQLRIIDAFHNNRFSIALTARQMGKCLQPNSIIKHNDEAIKIKKLVKHSFRQRIVLALETLLIKLSRSYPS